MIEFSRMQMLEISLDNEKLGDCLHNNCHIQLKRGNYCPSVTLELRGVVTRRGMTGKLLDKQKASQCPNFYLRQLGRVICKKWPTYFVGFLNIGICYEPHTYILPHTYHVLCFLSEILGV